MTARLTQNNPFCLPSHQFLNMVNILSDEKADGFAHGQITEDFLKTHLSGSTRNVYICGPPPMIDAIEKQLSNLKIDKEQIVKEAF